MVRTFANNCLSVNLFFSAIPMEDLKSISKFSKAKHILFLVDACYSGLAAVSTRGLNTNVPNYIDKITKENYRGILEPQFDFNYDSATFLVWGAKNKDKMNKDDLLNVLETTKTTFDVTA